MRMNPPKKKKAASWLLPIPGDDESKMTLMAKIKTVKDMLKAKMNRATNYHEILNVVLDAYMEKDNRSQNVRGKELPPESFRG